MIINHLSIVRRVPGGAVKIALKMALFILAFGTNPYFAQAGDASKAPSPSEMASEILTRLKSGSISLERKVALLKFAIKTNLSFNEKSKPVVKDFILRQMTAAASLKSGVEGNLSKQAFIDLFEEFGFRLTQADMGKYFTDETFLKCDDAMFNSYLTLIFENGLYTEDLFGKYVKLLSLKMSPVKKGWLLQQLTLPPYGESDMLKLKKGEKYYDVALEYYCDKTDKYDDEEFQKKYAKVFYDFAIKDDDFLIYANSVEEICWDGLVLSMEEYVSEEKLRKLFMKRLKLIAESHKDDIIVNYLKDLNSGDTFELEILPVSSLKLLLPLLESNNKEIVKGVMAVFKTKTDKDYGGDSEAWRKAISEMSDGK